MVVLASSSVVTNTKMVGPIHVRQPNIVMQSSSSSSSILKTLSLHSKLKLGGVGICSSSCVKTIDAVAADTTQPSSSSDKNQTSKKYYFVVANAKFMLDEEEHFKELMFERLRLFEERNMEQDFWLVIEPKFLDKFPNITKRLKRPAVALVSTNGPWITFMKLRLDRVLAESYEADNMEEALASNPTKIEFDKPDKWTAPYQKYEYGWWDRFLPLGSPKPEDA